MVSMDMTTVLDPTPTGVAIDPNPVQLPNGTWRVQGPGSRVLSMLLPTEC